MQTETLAWFVVAFVVGAAVSWLVAHGRSASDHGMAQERIAAREREIQTLQEAATKQEALLQQKESACDALGKENAGLQAQVDAAKESTRQRIEDEQMLKDAFSALAADALHKNNDTFVALAKEKLGEQQNEARTDLEMRKKAVEEMLQPMKVSLEKLGVDTAALELKREGAYATVLAEIGNIKQTHELLRGETNQLVSALRDSGTRGAWGSLQLARCIEFAGMIKYCSFELEKFVRLESGESQRPDCVLYLPNKRTVIIDAKTPMDAFLQAISPTLDADERKRQLLRHADQVRAHLDDLERKAYWKQFRESPDFVICFLPKEALFSAALEADPSLIDYGSGKVILSTPTTLIALLKAIAYGWQQVEMARDAQSIRETAIALYDKVASLYDSFAAIGERLKSTAKAWEKTRVQMEGRGGVFSLGRRLRKYGIGSADLKETNELLLEMHSLQAEDWKPDSTLSLAASQEDATLATEESV
jgi:DNA recombination protein RmuC